MRILVIGGTQFSGRHLVDQAIEAGDEVTIFHRGTAAPDGVPGTIDVRGDRMEDLDRLVDGTWDATIDMCAYLPRHVDALADALRDRGGHHLLVSTISVYADIPPGSSEAANVHPAAGDDVTDVTPETYGPLKVACEERARARHERLTITRPTYIVGPRDHTGRFSSWVHRVAAGGEITVPGPPDAPIQVIDARDLSAFHLHLARAQTAGLFHVADRYPPRTLADAVETIASVVAPPGTTIRWRDGNEPTAPDADDDWPSWRVTPDGAALMSIDTARAAAAGLGPRPLADTVTDLAAWLATPEGRATVAS